MDQKEYWNGEVGERWAKNQERFDEVFQPLRGRAVEVAAARLGERFVDIGCGAGGTLLDLARRVGPDGHGLGVDISEPLLARARQRIDATTGIRAEAVLADAATLPFAGDRDLVFSAFGVMFFEDPRAAFTNIRRALRPAGRLVFLCWRPMEESEVMAVPMRAARPLLPAAAPVPPDAPGPFAFADRDRTARMLSSAGFQNVSIEPFDAPVRIGKDLDEALTFALELGPSSRAFADAAEDVKPKVVDAIRDAFASRVTPDGVSLRAATWIATGTP